MIALALDFSKMDRLNYPIKSREEAVQQLVDTGIEITPLAKKYLKTNMNKQEIINWLEKEIAAHEAVEVDVLSADFHQFVRGLKETLKFVNGCPWIEEPVIESEK